MSDRGTARVLIYYRAPSGDSAIIEKAYHEISAELAATDGLLRNELLRDRDEPDSFIVLSEWKDLKAFQAWETGPAHRGTTSPLRVYQDRDRGHKHYGIYDVVAVY